MSDEEPTAIVQNTDDAENGVNEDESVEETEPGGSAEAPGARLVVKRDGEPTEVVFAVVSPAVVGRFDPTVGPIDVDLGSIPEGSYVSRRHAKISQDDEGGWHISDLGSSNGTFLLRDDWERVEESELADGDEVALGNAKFVFHTG